MTPSYYRPKDAFHVLTLGAFYFTVIWRRRDSYFHASSLFRILHCSKSSAKQVIPTRSKRIFSVYLITSRVSNSTISSTMLSCQYLLLKEKQLRSVICFRPSSKGILNENRMSQNFIQSRKFMKSSLRKKDTREK